MRRQMYTGDLKLIDLFGGIILIGDIVVTQMTCHIIIKSSHCVRLEGG